MLCVGVHLAYLKARPTTSFIILKGFSPPLVPGSHGPRQPWRRDARRRLLEFYPTLSALVASPLNAIATLTISIGSSSLEPAIQGELYRLLSPFLFSRLGCFAFGTSAVWGGLVWWKEVSAWAP